MVEDVVKYERYEGEEKELNTSLNLKRWLYIHLNFGKHSNTPTRE